MREYLLEMHANMPVEHRGFLRAVEGDRWLHTLSLAERTPGHRSLVTCYLERREDEPGRTPAEMARRQPRLPLRSGGVKN